LRIIIECEFSRVEIHPRRHVACEHLGPPPDLVYRPPAWQSVTLAEPAHPTTFLSRRGPIYRALSYLRRNA
jgi:hypothetical protein